MSKKEFNESLKEIIKSRMDELGGKIELAEAKELIRPHFEYDTDTLIENALANKTRYIIYALKDVKGIRNCFANDDGIYIEISPEMDEEEMAKIEKQIKEKVYGLLKVWHKIRGQRKEIFGQISFDELDAFALHEA